MTMGKAARTGLVLVLTFGLALFSVPGVLAIAQEGGVAAHVRASLDSAPEQTAVYEKSEAVYANLDAYGAPEAVYVVNRLEVSEGGTAVDYGTYSSVQNLTDLSEVEQAGEAVVCEVEPGVFFYQGNATSTALPWDISIAYELDGKQVAADELAGANGALRIVLSVARNASFDAEFYDSFMVQATFTLPGEAVAGLSAPDGVVASSGQDRTVAFTALPGHEETFELEARVSDFYLPSIQIVALPYTSVIDMPDTDEMTSGFDELSDAVSALAQGADELAAGARTLAQGTGELASGSSAFKSGLQQLSDSSAAILTASAQIREALARAAGGLAGADFSSFAQMGELAGALEQMAAGLDELRASASAVQEGYAQATSALASACASIPEATVGQQDIESLMALAQSSGTAQDAASVQALAEAYQAAQVAKGTIAAVQPALEAASSLLGALGADADAGGALAAQASALLACAAQVSAAASTDDLEQLSELAAGLQELSSQYGQFHAGVEGYASGVATLAQSYEALDGGMRELSGGTSELSSGTGELSSGVASLDAATITLPDEVRKQVDEMMADYMFPAFEGTSFASARNSSVSQVQFVFATAAIEKPESEQVEQAEPELSIWDRLCALFF